MNQILKINNNKFSIELSNEISKMSYDENFIISKKGKLKKNKTDRLQNIKKFIIRRKYQLQFIVSLIIAIVFLAVMFVKLYQNNQKKKLSKDLLNNYQLTTLYSDNTQYQANKSDSVVVENPFVIGMIKIDKINLSYPILSETNYDLLKISVCRFTGPMPNEIR